MSHWDCSNHHAHRLNCHSALKHDLMFHYYPSEPAWPSVWMGGNTTINIEGPSPWAYAGASIATMASQFLFGWLGGGYESSWGGCYGGGYGDTFESSIGGGGSYVRSGKRSKKSDKSDKTEKPDKTDKSNETDSPSKTDKGDRADRSSSDDDGSLEISSSKSSKSSITTTNNNSSITNISKGGKNRDYRAISKMLRKTTDLEKQKADADKAIADAAGNEKKLKKAEKKLANVLKDVQKLLNSVNDYGTYKDDVCESADEKALANCRARLMALLGLEPEVEVKPEVDVEPDKDELLDDINDALQDVSDVNDILEFLESDGYSNLTPEQKSKLNNSISLKFGSLINDETDPAKLNGLKERINGLNIPQDLKAKLLNAIDEKLASLEEQSPEAEESDMTEAAKARFEGITLTPSKVTGDDLTDTEGLVSNDDFNPEDKLEKAVDKSGKTRPVTATADNGYSMSNETYSETNFPLYMSIKDKDNSKLYHYKCVSTVEKDGNSYAIYKSPDNVNEYVLSSEDGKLQLKQLNNKFGGFGVPDKQQSLVNKKNNEEEVVEEEVIEEEEIIDNTAPAEETQLGTPLFPITVTYELSSDNSKVIAKATVKGVEYTGEAPSGIPNWQTPKIELVLPGNKKKALDDLKAKLKDAGFGQDGEVVTKDAATQAPAAETPAEEPAATEEPAAAEPPATTEEAKKEAYKAGEALARNLRGLWTSNQDEAVKSMETLCNYDDVHLIMNFVYGYYNCYYKDRLAYEAATEFKKGDNPSQTGTSYYFMAKLAEQVEKIAKDVSYDFTEKEKETLNKIKKGEVAPTEVIAKKGSDVTTTCKFIDLLINNTLSKLYKKKYNIA